MKKNTKSEGPSAKVTAQGAAVRPVGIAVFSWLIIIVSALNILALPAVMQQKTVFFPVFYFIVSSASVASGIGLLRLRGWARTAIIAISILMMVETVATYPQALRLGREEALRQFEAIFAKELDSSRMRDPAATERIEAGKEISRKSSFVAVDSTIMAGIIVSVAFNCAVILYFSRRKIRGLYS